MNRPMLIVVGVLVIAGIVFFVIGNQSNTEEAGRFADAETCSELQADFDSAPVPDSAAGRREMGDEFRARFRQLGC